MLYGGFTVALYMLREGWKLYRGFTVYVEGYGGHYIGLTIYVEG